MRKLTRSHFIRTFNINELLIGTFFMAILAFVPIKVIETQMRNNTSSILTEYLKIMEKVLWIISNTLFGLIVFTAVMFIIMIGTELMIRISKDSLSNWFKSILVSYRLRKFLMNQNEPDGERAFKLQQYNKAIKKSVIDVRNKKITYIIKLPNDFKSQNSIFDIKGILREELSSCFPDYLISNFERNKQWLIIEGTKKS